ncbi:Dvir\GJ17601-PA-like protein [Anopheles sinensis]|uniref:Dvir\GJ17601-PA-like protein n=1 Tax=Anopheles sinensis TaxID=74873 RepID=A0A084WSV4_ANOSI|nr:Dvir\GJ17601-PA-like protein [Anopheles sinensis]
MIARWSMAYGFFLRFNRSNMFPEKQTDGSIHQTSGSGHEFSYIAPARSAFPLSGRCGMEWKSCHFATVISGPKNMDDFDKFRPVSQPTTSLSYLLVGLCAAASNAGLETKSVGKSKSRPRGPRWNGILQIIGGPVGDKMPEVTGNGKNLLSRSREKLKLMVMVMVMMMCLEVRLGAYVFGWIIRRGV